jgi:RNA polymerase sigma factor (sigma-70 family)
MISAMTSDFSGPMNADASDGELLAHFVQGSESAFTALVHRHIDAVYSSALRQVRDPHTAADVTSAVFLILARKAKRLTARTVIPAWLHRTTRFVALKAIRTNQRRQRYEQEAARMQETLSATEAVAIWDEVAPLLDDGLTQLSVKDHEAVLLRFFHGRTFPEIATLVGGSEESARKRVERAVEKLRRFFTRQGVAVPSALLAAALAANAVKASPPALSGSIRAAKATGPSTPLLLEALRALRWRVWKQIGAGLAVMAIGGLVAYFTLRSRFLVRTTPLQIVRLLIQAANDGDGERWSTFVHVTTLEEQQIRSLLSSNIVAQSALRRALIRRFGQTEYEASGFPRLLDDTPESQMAAATERITGDRAVVHWPRGSNWQFVFANRSWEFDFFRTTLARADQLRSSIRRDFVALRAVTQQVSDGRYGSAAAARADFQRARR